MRTLNNLQGVGCELIGAQMDPGEGTGWERTEDDGNDPIADLGREASVSVEKVTPEKVLCGALPGRRNGCERFWV
jgi:hypothetical protein